ncbi:DUF1631 family protein [Solimonas soli]|uniref:DUF1631 family protein n=1 Tax=Solimonas soli TaxID=413479 RepID=UPI00146F9866|nr:DUF1631 family protein [Solimonas soli]
MSAQSHASARAANPSAPAAGGNPVVAALHQMAISVLAEQLNAMFEKADDILFDSAEKARSSDEQRLYLDTMRIVRMQRAQIIKAFEHSLQDALSRIGTEAPGDNVDLSDMTQWSLQDGDQLEERIAVSNMESKATSLHAHELVELQRRMARLADMTGGQLSPDAISPARIIRAFQNSVQNLQVDFPIKLVIYKLFDRVVVGNMSAVFVHANQLLAGHGVEPKDGAVPPPKRHPAMPGMPGAAATLPGADSGAMPSWVSGVDTQRFAQYMGVPPPSPAPYGVASPNPPPYGGAGFGAMPGPAAGYPPSWPAYAGAYAAAGGAAPSYNDAWLAHDISHILQSYSHGQQPQAPAWLPPQNVGLVARMFDGYYNDPRLPEAMKPLLAKLQLPVMKAALADPQFFASSTHPARRATNDLYELALQLGAGGAPVPEQIVSELQGLVDEIARSFHLDPAKLKSAPGIAVDEHTADSFLRQQDETQQNRNRQQIERIRRIVAHELKMRVGERVLPTGAMRLMLSGFGPRLCVDYIRDGIEGRSWVATMDLVDRVLHSLGPDRRSAEERVALEAELVAEVTNRLAEVGFARQKLEDVVAGLLQAYLERKLEVSLNDALIEEGLGDVATRPDAPPQRQPTPEQELQGLLSIVLLPGAWFTLYESGAQTKHWVRVKAYYPAQQSVLLGHYMEERFISMRALVFATELAEGRLAAIDPAPELQTAIARIAALPFTREPASALGWLQNPPASA